MLLRGYKKSYIYIADKLEQTIQNVLSVFDIISCVYIPRY